MSKPGLGHRHRTIVAILRKQAAAGEPCWICNRPIDTRLPEDGGPPGRSRWAFSADHLRPRAKGGQTTLANYAPAHYGCNSSRGDGTRKTKTKRKTRGIRRW